MPHVVIEHTDKTADQMPSVCKDVFDAAAQCSTFTDPSAIKVRSRLCANHTGGTGDDFAHATIRMLQGRDDAAKGEVADAVMGVLAAHLTHVANLTVEVVDMDKPSYRKRSL